MGRMKDYLIQMEESGKTFEEVTFEDSLKHLYSTGNEGLQNFMSKCKTVLMYRKDNNFKSLSSEKQQKYIKDEGKVDIEKKLIELLCSVEKITLFDIYSTISNYFDKYDLNKNILDLNSILKDKDNILLTSVEMYANRLQDLLKNTADKNITIWVFDDMLHFILENDYIDYPNIKVVYRDLYYSNDETKFSTILCIPEFMHQRNNKSMDKHFKCKDLGVYGLNILFNQNLNKDGKIYIVLSNKVNYSDSEKTFRNEYQKHLVAVKNLPGNTFNFSRIKTYLYEFSKAEYNGPIMLTGFEKKQLNTSVAKKFDEILSNGKWDFEKPFTNDLDIECLKKSNFKYLENFALVKRGNALSLKAVEVNNQKEDFIFIDLPELSQDNIDYEKAKKYKCENDLSKHYIKYGDILIPNRGNTTNIAIHKKKDCNCIVSQYITIIRVNSDIEPEFLALYLKSKIGQKMLKSIQRVAVVSMINHEDIEEIPVPVFDKRKRMEILNNYTDKIEVLQKQRNEIDKKIEELNNNLNDILCGKIKQIRN